jgi:hypothetical protein
LHERELNSNRRTARQAAAADYCFSNNEFKPAQILMNYLTSFLLLLTSMLLGYVCECKYSFRSAFVLFGIVVLKSLFRETQNISPQKTVGHNGNT